jgi:hypothetical protein
MKTGSPCTRTRTRTQSHTNVHTRAFTHTQTHTHAHTCTHTCTHTHTHACRHVNSHASPTYHVQAVWKDPVCGDGLCETPFEFASYGRFGCRADCGNLIDLQSLMSLDIDLYYNFGHQTGSLPAAVGGCTACGGAKQPCRTSRPAVSCVRRRAGRWPRRQSVLAGTLPVTQPPWGPAICATYPSPFRRSCCPRQAGIYALKRSSTPVTVTTRMIRALTP